MIELIGSRIYNEYIYQKDLREFGGRCQLTFWHHDICKYLHTKAILRERNDLVILVVKVICIWLQWKKQ